MPATRAISKPRRDPRNLCNGGPGRFLLKHANVSPTTGVPVTLDVAHSARYVRWVFSTAPFSPKTLGNSVVHEGEHLYGRLVDRCNRLVFTLKKEPQCSNNSCRHKDSSLCTRWTFHGYFELCQRQSFDWIQLYLGPFLSLFSVPHSSPSIFCQTYGTSYEGIGPWLLGFPNPHSDSSRVIQSFFDDIVAKELGGPQLANKYGLGCTHDFSRAVSFLRTALRAPLPVATLTSNKKRQPQLQDTKQQLHNSSVR